MNHSSVTPSNNNARPTSQIQAALVKQHLKDIQVQDMLKLTQSNVTGGTQGYFGTGISSTRNSKQVAHISGHHSI